MHEEAMANDVIVGVVSTNSCGERSLPSNKRVLHCTLLYNRFYDADADKNTK